MGGNFIQAIATLVGTIIGVGLFTIPFVVYKAGILTLFIYLPFLAIIEYVLLKYYADLVMAIHKPHRLPGYVEIFLGSSMRWPSRIVSMIGKIGALLAYIIVGGIFLHSLFNGFLGGNVEYYTIALFLIEILIVWFGIKAIARFEVFMTTILFASIIFIIAKGMQNVSLANYTLLNWQAFFLPYGPILFAVGGMDAVPNMCEILKRDKRKIYSALKWGVFLSAVVMMLFVAIVVGITGVLTTADALSGLDAQLGNGIVKAILVFGILSIVTSFLTIAQATRDEFEQDWFIGKYKAFFLMASIPYLLYVSGVQSLTKVVSATGAITGGLLGILLILVVHVLYKKQQKNKKINLSWVFIGVPIILIIGVVLELKSIFFK